MWLLVRITVTLFYSYKTIGIVLKLLVRFLDNQSMTCSLSIMSFNFKFHAFLYNNARAFSIIGLCYFVESMKEIIYTRCVVIAIMLGLIILYTQLV